MYEPAAFWIFAFVTITVLWVLKAGSQRLAARGLRAVLEEAMSDERAVLEEKEKAMLDVGWDIPFAEGLSKVQVGEDAINDGIPFVAVYRDRKEAS